MATNKKKISVNSEYLIKNNIDLILDRFNLVLIHSIINSERPEAFHIDKYTKENLTSVTGLQSRAIEKRLKGLVEDGVLIRKCKGFYSVNSEIIK